MAQLADFYPDQNDGAEGGGEQPSVPVALNMSRTPGEALRMQRENLGLTLEQVHAVLRIRVEYLQALEDQHFKLIPSQGYVKSWLRKYAQFLKLDADQVVARFEKENAVFEETPVEAVDMGKRSIGARGRISALALVLMLIAGGWFGLPALLREMAPPKKAEPVAVLENGVPEATIGGAPIVADAETALVIRAREPAWLEARGPDGTIFLSRELAAGETYEPAAGPGWTVFAKNGGAFEVYYNNAFIGLLGEPGVEVQAYRLEEAVKAAQADQAAAKEAQAAAAIVAAQAAKARTTAANEAAVAPAAAKTPVAETPAPAAAAPSPAPAQ
ncbi:MAG: RodZ domain-containing protein [Caulobacterales bacterium]